MSSLSNKIILILIFIASTASAEKITVLTHPVNSPTSDPWHHPAVTYSLLRGLKNLHTDFNYNPSLEAEVGSVVVVLANMDALKQAIKWRQSGKIQKLLAGPTLVISPLDHNGIVRSPWIDRYIVNSKWTKTAYIEDAPEMIHNLVIWPAGVDPDLWAPSQQCTKMNSVLVYWKTGPMEFCESVEAILRKYHWDPVRIRYGNYDHATFRQLLDLSAFAVFISRSESQGIALAEAWSMNVPSLAWNPKELTANNRKYSECSACPWLTPATGLDWNSFEEFEALLQRMPQNLMSFHPREWVLENMSDTATARILLSIIDSTGK